jgi:APA family basic amino acid/polyamine antiporter
MNLFRKKSIQTILQSHQGESDADHPTLSKHLGVRDLTGMGIAAIIGAGIFSTIGNASASGGPGVVLLFLFTAVACGFAAFAYAEFASLVPVSGSAYTYSYVAFGELVAWIMGWALIMEYAIGNITVAISWSDYFTEMIRRMGVTVPDWMTMDYFTAHDGFNQSTALLNAGKPFEQLGENLRVAYSAWTGAPQIGSLHLILDIPALVIIFLVTVLVYRGIRETKNASNLMVIIKLLIVFLVIAVGVFYVNTDNWNPFLPNGFSGVMRGVSAVFFAYIGFDALSTTAEECKNPQRDLPRGMLWSIIICTVLYILIALILTGMVPSGELAVGDPLAYVFHKLNISWMTGLVSVSAVIAMTGVLLVFQLGQPRIWMSMSRDGLLPKKFSTVHPRFHTPGFATIMTGFMVGIPALFMNITMVTDLCSIGTLFAFVLVCGGVLRLQLKPDSPRGKFTTPYINARYIFPAMILTALLLGFTLYRNETQAFLFNEKQMLPADQIIASLDHQELATVKSFLQHEDAHGLEEAGSDIVTYLSGKSASDYSSVLMRLPLEDSRKYQDSLTAFSHKIPTWIFILTTLFLAVMAIRHRLSLIPLLGLVCCLYMMSELGVHNWMGFGIWLLAGLLIYFGYGYRNSKLAKQ